MQGLVQPAQLRERRPQVETEQDRLFETIDYTKNSLGELISKLHPALRCDGGPECQECPLDVVKDEALVPVADRIRMARRQVEEINRIICDLSARIEL